MIEIKIIDGKLFNCNMLIVEEDNTERLLERLKLMLNLDINHYQCYILESAIKEIEIIKKVS